MRGILLLLAAVAVTGLPAGEPSGQAPEVELTVDGSPIAELVDYRFSPVERFLRARDVYAARHPDRSVPFAMVIEPITEKQKRDGSATMFYEPPGEEQARADRSRSFRGGFARPVGACDSNTECERETESTCKQAGYEDGVCNDSVAIITRLDGTKLCTADCCGVSTRGTTGGVALIECHAELR